jgi:uncharacterized cupredoxin-like copper-binding protein
VKAGLLAVGLATAALMPGAHASRPVTVDVTIHHSQFMPSHFSFPAGTTVRFEVRNTDPTDHEFIIGSRFVQYYMEHSAERVHDAPGQISVPAGTTRQTAYTFGSVPVLFGCHLPGHYAYGMRGTIAVTH